MPLQLTPLPADRFHGWQAAARRRIVARNQESGMRVGADAVAYADLLLSETLAAPSSTILRIDDDGRELGTVWLAVAGRKLFLLDLATDAALSGAQDDALLAAVADVAREGGATRITAGLHPQDAAAHALIRGRGFALASIQMVLDPLPVRAERASVVVAPMTDERFAAYAATSEIAFAQDLVGSGRYAPEEAAIQARRQFAAELPDGLDTAGQELFTASVDGVEVGVLWIGLRERGGRPHAFVLDIEVAEDQRRRGYGRALMLRAESEARRLGAGSIGLHVFGFNAGAIELYEQLGYRRTEETWLLDL